LHRTDHHFRLKQTNYFDLSEWLLTTRLWWLEKHFERVHLCIYVSQRQYQTHHERSTFRRARLIINLCNTNCCSRTFPWIDHNDRLESLFLSVSEMAAISSILQKWMYKHHNMWLMPSRSFIVWASEWKSAIYLWIHSNLSKYDCQFSSVQNYWIYSILRWWSGWSACERKSAQSWSPQHSQKLPFKHSDDQIFKWGGFCDDRQFPSVFEVSSLRICTINLRTSQSLKCRSFSPNSQLPFLVAFSLASVDSWKQIMLRKWNGRHRKHIRNGSSSWATKRWMTSENLIDFLILCVKHKSRILLNSSWDCESEILLTRCTVLHRLYFML
jgi:hypothetical protein